MIKDRWHYLVRSRDCVAQGALTNSKRAECFIYGQYPTHIRSSWGAFVEDHLNNKYIDYICGLGTNLLGYANAQIASAITIQARSGISPSLSTTLEVDFLERIKEVVPFIDVSKIFKTGTEACLASLKMARGYTGRELVFSSGYHGHGAEFISLNPVTTGVCKHSNIRALDWDFVELRENAKKTAAVIVEPINLDDSRDNKEKLKELKKICKENGIVLIFDEIITAFRVPKYTVSSYYNIRPDIIIFGKALGAGMPLCVVGGRRDILNGSEYFTSGTFCGETLSLAAAMKFVELIQTNSKYKIDDLWLKANNFQNEFNQIWPDKIRLKGYGTRSVFEGDDMVKALLWQEAVNAGILFGSSFFYSFAHFDMDTVVLGAVKNILTRIQNNEVTLKGKLPESPFSKKVRDSNGENTKTNG